MNNSNVCISCYKYFNTPQELNEHLSECNKYIKHKYHKKSKGFKCRYCGVLCKSKETLNIHYGKCSKKRSMDIIIANDFQNLNKYFNIDDHNINQLRFGDIMRLTAYIPKNDEKK